MTNRRDFLHAAALTAGGLTLTPALRAADVRQSLNLHAVLIDGRHAPARTFGARLAAYDATLVLEIADGDITQLWLQQIGPAWRQRPVALAGLTDRSALFCLEQLGAISGVRVVFHAEHIILPDGGTEHQVLRGANAADLAAQELVRAGPLWPQRIAKAIATHRTRNERVRVGPSDAGLEPNMSAGAQLLTSWIIAPA
jgi:hypothetical protein